MSMEFQSRLEELSQTLDHFKKFLITNSKSVKNTLSLETKNFLQVMEETLNDPLISEDQKKEQIQLMKTFLEKLKDFYSNVSVSTETELIEITERIKESAKFLGFTGKESNYIFSELENTLEKLEKKEIVL